MVDVTTRKQRFCFKGIKEHILGSLVLREHGLFHTRGSFYSSHVTALVCNRGNIEGSKPAA